MAFDCIAPAADSTSVQRDPSSLPSCVNSSQHRIRACGSLIEQDSNQG